MHIKNKKGFVLLEVLIVINILIVLISLYARQNLVNIRKAKYYTIKEDIMTLNIEEEQFIKESEIKISSDIELVTKLKENDIEKIKRMMKVIVPTYKEPSEVNEVAVTEE